MMGGITLCFSAFFSREAVDLRFDVPSYGDYLFWTVILVDTLDVCVRLGKDRI
jgi:hypothetical protein